MSNIKLFEDTNIRAKWNEDEDCWYFVVQDVIAFLTESNQPAKYWSAIKARTLENEGVELSTNCRQLKFKAKDGKEYRYESASNETIFRIVQSIPSSKAEPFKRWLAKLGKERIEEIENPQRAIERGKLYYQAKGRPPEWISDRVSGIESRKALTDQWKEGGVKGVENGILTNEIYVSTFGLSAIKYKEHKGLDSRDSLRNHMTSIELVVTRFAEAAATEVSKSMKAKGLEENRKAIKESGKIVNKAVKELEEKTGNKIVSDFNFKDVDSDEMTRQIIQSENSTATPLPEFDRNLKGLTAVPPPPKKEKKK